MDHAKRIIQAFKSNEIQRILLVDDAYDPPDLDEDVTAPVADFLLTEEGLAACEDCGIEPDTRERAASAAEAGDPTNPALVEMYHALYARFTETGEERFDPGERFRLIKEGALKDLHPLRAFLGQCGDGIQVRTVGLDNAPACFGEFRPQVLFLDYYLSDDVPPTGDVSEGKKEQARKASLDLLRQLVETKDIDGIPAIVLMSSREIADVNSYRHDLGEPHVLALRFHFLQKRSILYKDGKLVPELDAVNALLNTSQGYLFRQQVQHALAQWKNGAEDALRAFMENVSDLETKDFAYLLRFRLREDGQTLGDYLDWFFGECLKGFVEEKVDWQHSSFASLNADGRPEQGIEGAFEGPSPTIARLFHRVRVTSRRGHPGMDYRLGDLFAERRTNRICTVITPDCDLVQRNGPPKAESVLTMRGTVKSFDDENSSADDFLLLKDGLCSVRWDPKDLQTFPYSGRGALATHYRFKFLGTLRPLYAQEIQRRALTDLARVGLPVAPAFGINTPASVWVREAGRHFTEIHLSSQAIATMVPPRTGEHQVAKFVLRRRFLDEMITKLSQIAPDSMSSGDHGSLRALQTEDALEKLYATFLIDGGRIGDNCYGIGLTMGTEPRQGKKANWLQIVLGTPADVMETIVTFDPITNASG
ncbi:MAG: hypothetical protein F4Y02_11310 [Chloroflexi bacterium]|nr:hypothetical protein [Chloroflexota bacterium]